MEWDLALDHEMDAPGHVACGNCGIVRLVQAVVVVAIFSFCGVDDHDVWLDGILRAELLGQCCSLGLGVCRMVVR